MRSMSRGFYDIAVKLNIGIELIRAAFETFTMNFGGIFLRDSENTLYIVNHFLSVFSVFLSAASKG